MRILLPNESLRVPSKQMVQEKAVGLAPSESGAPTLASDDGPLWRVAFSGDPHFGRPQSNLAATQQILSTADREAYDAFFILGDIVELGADPAHWQQAVDTLAAYETPLRPIMGNHDAGLGGEQYYQELFFPGSADTALSDSGSMRYWSIRLKGARIFALDLRWGSEDFDPEQRAWFERELAATPKETFVVVISHCFMWSSGVDGIGYQWYDHPGMLRDLEPLFVRYGVDLHLSGHNHYMEFLEANGVAYAVVGAMGGLPDPPPSYRSPASKWFKQGQFGFVELAGYSDRYHLIFRDTQGVELFQTEIAIDF